MAEREVLIEKARVEFDGLFDLRDMMNQVKALGSDKGYFHIEKRHTESVSPDGKFIELDIVLTKKLTDYARSDVAFFIQAQNVKEKVVEVKKHKRRLLHGHLIILVDGSLITDYERRWEIKPTFYVLRAIFERYVYSSYLNSIRTQIKDDSSFMIENLKAYLNLEKYQ
jgi:hypothetical protein